MKGLKEKEIEKIKDELDNSQRPVFLFHDDADGLCSFLLFYRYLKEGRGVVVKSKPMVDAQFSRSVIDYEADKVFVLDIAILKQDFVDEVKRPVIWIDHHKPGDLNKVIYFNPRKHKSDIVYPVTNICYDVVKQDLWIAMVGCIGDWHMPYFKAEFCKEYPDLMNDAMEDPGDVLFETKLGKLVKIFNFILKGSNNDAMKCVKVLTRIESPYDILEQKTSQGKYIYSKFEKMNEGYNKLLDDIKKKVKKDDKFIVYTYPDIKMSFTGEVSNELLHIYPDKIIIIAREKSGEMRMSLRSKGVLLPPKLEKALSTVQGYGGGHEYACGACVKKEDFPRFIESLRKEID